jgi:arsenite methyltransferase
MRDASPGRPPGSGQADRGPMTAPRPGSAPLPSLEALWPAPDYRERWRQLLALLDPRPGERVLDVGAGRGEAVRFAERRVGPSGLAVGVEYGTPAGRAGGLRRLVAGRTAGAGAFPIVAADAQALPFRDGTFDAVLSVNVLEALPDRRRGLAELRRVLRPSGRAVVAHDDWESQVYTGADRDLGRRAVQAYAAATFGSYAASDGQMGRHLWGLVRGAGFREVELRVLPLVNTEYRQPLSGWQHSQFDAALVAGVSDLTDADLERWRADLAASSAAGCYVYVSNLYVCLGRA